MGRASAFDSINKQKQSRRATGYPLVGAFSTASSS